ncbi:Mitochondrial distribution and morphology protein 34 [Pleurotus pulmonarius]
MSFTFNWPRFSDQFHYDAIQMLNNALNKGNKPPVIADKIEVIELEMGTQPPELEIRDIGELTMDQFRGIFRLTYAGDAHLVLKTKVQANPLNHKQPDIHLMTGSRGMLAAKQPLVVPMLLRLSNFKLNSYVVLVVSKQKGITLVFKTDPLQNVDINSTFDSIAVIQKFIQREIEGQLRQMFREDLPGIIHRLSQQWVKAKVEAPYLLKRPPPPPNTPSVYAASAPDLSMTPNSPSTTQAFSSRPYPLSTRPRPPRSVSGVSMTSTSRRPTSTVKLPPPTVETASSFPDLENFDPTYGLRPEGLPNKSLFHGFSSLFTPNKGLADLAEEPSDIEDGDDEMEPFDVVDWDSMIPRASPPPSVTYVDDNRTEYETIPAIGGGTITRPRVVHAQSRASTDFSSGTAMSPAARSFSYDRLMSPRTAGISPGFATPGLYPTRNTSFSYFSPEFAALRLQRGPGSDADTAFESSVLPPGFSTRRPLTPDSAETQQSRSSSSGFGHSLETPPSSDPFDPQFLTSDSATSPIFIRRAPSTRRPSVSSTSAIPEGSPSSPFLSSSSPPEHPDPKIILKPTANNTIHQLSTLSHSNHTLSPYVRSLEHFTVRSVPPRDAGPAGPSSSGDRQPVKARRKRMYRVGSKKKPTAEDTVSPDIEQQMLSRRATASPTPPSEFDADDMDRYFRTRDDYVPLPPNLHPSHIRRRQPHDDT